MTYFVAASFKEGFSADELYYFTKAMVETGDRLHFPGIVADKHSVGGLSGARASMIIVPIVVAAGFTMPKISSRAITSAAGTADAMEVIAGVDFPLAKIEDIVHQVGGCIAWNGKLNIAPADDIIIRIEEPLAFESFDKLIVSIMAKKIAMSTTHLILDIPLGKTMKIKHLNDAELIVKKFQMLGKKFGVKIVPTINKSSEPPGNGIGPMLETIDVLKVLEQTADRPIELEERALFLAGSLLDLCFTDAKIHKQGSEEARTILRSGSALKKFRQIVAAQGGSAHIASTDLVNTNKKHIVRSSMQGYVREIDNLNLNSVAKLLGAPRDKQAGIVLHKRVGDAVELREPLLTLYAKDTYHLREAENTLLSFPIHKLHESL
jgi:AMP phosphorylase